MELPDYNFYEFKESLWDVYETKSKKKFRNILKHGGLKNDSTTVILDLFFWRCL